MSRPPASLVPSRPAGLVVGLLLLVLVVLVAGSASASADPEPVGPGVVEGVVRDRQGAAVAGARIVVVTEATDATGYRRFERAAVSDPQGRYRVEGIVLPTGYVLDDGRGFSASLAGFATEGVPGVVQRLKAYDGTPLRVDVVLRRRDVVLRGRLSVRGGASVDGGGVTATPATAPGPFDSWDTAADADGRWELRVPAGTYRLQGASRYGLPTRWPDLATARPAPATRVAAPGETIEGLDISMRPRLRDGANDEFGAFYEGWDVDPNTGRSVSPTVGIYPRDTYRSVTSPNGPAIEIGTPRTSSTLLPGLPADELLTVTGLGLPVEVPIRNTGDDVLWVGDVHVEGPSVIGSSCRDALRDCTGGHIMPGETRTVSVTILTAAYAPEYRSTLVVSSDAGVTRRASLVQRNVSDPGLAPGDQGLFDALIRYLPPAQQAAALVLGAPKRTPAATTLGIGAVVLRRSSLRVAFPGAGRVDVRIDRRIAARGRSAARWSPVRRVRVKTTRAGARTVRIRALARGRYRIRAVMTIGGGPAKRATAVGTVTR